MPYLAKIPLLYPIQTLCLGQLRRDSLNSVWPDRVLSCLVSSKFSFDLLALLVWLFQNGVVLRRARAVMNTGFYT